MQQYIIYIIFDVALVATGGLIATKLYTRITDLRKCIDCQYSLICDKGNPENKCHLDEEK